MEEYQQFLDRDDWLWAEALLKNCQAPWTPWTLDILKTILEIKQYLLNERLRVAQTEDDFSLCDADEYMDFLDEWCVTDSRLKTVREAIRFRDSGLAVGACWRQEGF